MKPINKTAALVVGQRWPDTRGTSFNEPAARTRGYWRADVRHELALYRRTSADRKKKENKPMKKQSKTHTVKTYIRDIERRCKALTKFEGKGPNPRNYVRMNASFMLTNLRRMSKIIGFAAMVVLAVPAFAGDREKHDRSHRREHHNYIIERQEAYEVQGTPSDRIIIGRREIDVYPDGSMYEGNALVGVKHDE